MNNRLAERRFVLGCIVVALILITAAAMLAPAKNGNDPSPTTTNSGPAGAKAAYLLLSRLGYQVDRWENPLANLDSVDASHTTLVLALPSREVLPRDREALRRFVDRGGRVLATDASGAEILPQGATADASGLPCVTNPEGIGPLAQVGPLTLHGGTHWKDDTPKVDVAQRCPGGGAAVVSYPVGAGRIIWWNDASPLTNKGLHGEANLRLLLASVGDPPRHVLFDEYLHQDHDLLWRSASGTPLNALKLQLGILFLLLIFSFSRRNGPIFPLVTSSRTSPLEFAHSMGNLYHRAGAGEAATDEGRQRFYGMLERQCGIPRETLDGPPTGIVAAIEERFNYADPMLINLLTALKSEDRISPAAALPKLQELHRQTVDLQRRLRDIDRNFTPMKEK